MCPGVVDGKIIPHVDLGQHPVNGKLVVVLAQTAGYVILVVAGCILLAQHGNVVVCPVDGRPHQICSAGIHADVFLVNVLFVYCLGDQIAVGAKHESAQFGKDGYIPQPCGYHDLLECLADALADGENVVGFLFRPIGDAHAAGQVYKADVCTGLLLEHDSSFKQHPCQLGVVGVGDGVACQEGMQTEVLDPLLHQDLEPIDQLLGGKAVLCLPRIVHDMGFDLKMSAGIVPAEDGLRQTCNLFQKVNVGDIIQVDVCAQLLCQLEILRRGHIGGEHDIAAGKAACLAHHQLRQRGAVHAAALLLQNFQNKGIGGRLDCKVFPVALVPGKRLLQLPCVLPDALFIVQIEGGGVLGGDALHDLLGCKRCFHSTDPFSF